jgi:predicted DNA-binding transcriptional regulator AlpA
MPNEKGEYCAMEMQTDLKTALDCGGRPGRFLRLPEVKRRLGISKSHFYQGIKEGRYPKPIKLGKRISVWREEDIDELIRNPR